MITQSFFEIDTNVRKKKKQTKNHLAKDRDDEREEVDLSWEEAQAKAQHNGSV